MEIKYKNELVLVEKKPNKVAIVTLNNPPLNLNTVASLEELRASLRMLDRDDDVNVVILTGSGTKAFNVGSDLTGFMAQKGDFVGKKFRMENDVMNNIEFLSKIVICAIEGHCMGGGMEMALACDIRVVAEDAHLSLPEINLGVFPGSGGLYRLPKLVGPSKALEISALGDPIDAQECLTLGIANHLAPHGETVAVAMSLAERLAQKPLNVLQAIKRGIREMWLKTSAENYYHNLDMVEYVYNQDNSFEGVGAFLEKREPHFK